ncbi:MAG: hypothetical protein L0H19_06165, partial [Salinisphaera sp.]|nr:hypothetical protein [Salinisphaera sp.]
VWRKLGVLLLAVWLFGLPGHGERNTTTPDPAVSGPVHAYEPPKLVRYDDMVDMFALDPPLPELPPLDVEQRP